MKIGNIDFGERPVFLAPMEDVTDIGFRMLCKRFGAAMVYTEFVSAEALIRDVKSTISKLTISDEERPVGIQIYGRDVEAMVEAAKIVEQAGPDLIDLNFGCPVKKVAGKGAGAGMLQNIPKMLEITQKVVDAVKLPVTVKTRLGWNHEQLIITSLAEQLQDCGIQGLTIHGRTRSQMYTGNADWTLIGEVKRNPHIHIPIIGNGDIHSLDEADKAFDEYGVDAVMIGRATFGCPWIFSREDLSPDQKLDVLEELLRINVERIDEKRGILHTRRHLAATPIFKGIPNFRQTRIAMLRAETMSDLLTILETVRKELFSTFYCTDTINSLSLQSDI
jgi:nifR3 family TIM-barrel protein